MSEKISIIGGGIAGLTTALFLKKAGVNARVFEAAPGIHSVGAGLGLGNNAMQIFHLLGIGDQIEAAGHRVNRMRITNQRLGNLQVIDLHYFEQKYGVHNLAIHRAALQQILSEHLDTGQMLLNKRVLQIENPTNYQMHFSDGSYYETEALIGADGIKSVVRQQLFGEFRIRPAGQVCWRGLCSFKLMDDYKHQAIEAWGKGRRFGFVYLSSTTLYWYAVADENIAAANGHSLSTLFKDFHPHMQEMIAITPPDAVIFGPLADLHPFRPWHLERACLIGDAAHATTPNMGQGACQAIEDAYTLGSLLAKQDIKSAFRLYEQLRVKKVNQIVKRSRIIGKVAHWQNAAAIGIRNWLMQKTPATISLQQLEPVFDIGYVGTKSDH